MILSVVFSGSDEERVQEAVEFIKQCLTPGSREYEVLQSRGRDALAVINGTVGIGSNFHQRQLRVLEADGLDEIERWRSLARHVRCEICGDRGHPTVDCPQNRMPSHDELMQDWRLDKEYNDLMASVVPEASPSTDDDGRFRPFKRQHTESLEGEGERPLPPPELPPLPLPPPLNRVPTPLPLRGSSSPESPDYSEVASEDQQSRATPIVPRPLVGRRQRRPMAPHPLRTIPVVEAPPYYEAGGYPTMEGMNYSPQPHGYGSGPPPPYYPRPYGGGPSPSPPPPQPPYSGYYRQDGYY